MVSYRKLAIFMVLFSALFLSFEHSYAQFYVTLEPVQTHFAGKQFNFSSGTEYTKSAPAGAHLYYFFTEPSCSIVKSITTEGSCFFNKQTIVGASQGFSDYPVEFSIGQCAAANGRDDSGKMMITLEPNPYTADGKWQISSVEFESFNIEGITDLKMGVNGKEVSFSDEIGWNWIRADFEEAEQWIDTITITAESGKPAAFAKIRLHAVPKLGSADTEFTARFNCNEKGVFPLPSLKGFAWNDPSEIGLHILDAGSRDVAAAEYNADSEMFTIPALGVGQYYACYYIVPAPGKEFPELRVESGVPFVSQPVIPEGSAINGAKIINGSVSVPTAVTEKDGSVSHTWENAALTMPAELIDEVYWKTALENKEQVYPAYNRLSQKVAKAATAAESGSIAENIPEEYTRYDDAAGIDLTGGNTIYLILAKNGVHSLPLRIAYERQNGSTGMESLSTSSLAEEEAEARYYHLNGTRAEPGSTPESKLLIRVTPSGAKLILK